MRNRIIIAALIPLFLLACNMTILNHKDYELKLKDLVWNIKIEGLYGEVYLHDSNLLFGRNWDSTFVVISPESGSVLDTLNPFTIEKERKSLIIDSTAEYKEDYSLHNIPVDKQKYSKVTLKSIKRQYRGDTNTFYLIVTTISNEEFTILFNRSQFNFISDIIYYKEGKFIIKYNSETSMDKNIPYKEYFGLLELGKIIKN